MRTHKNLEVWKDSLELTNEIYSLTKNFPKHERFGLSSQMERAAVSVTSNIAEGAARGSDKEFIRFLYYSVGSISELETQLFVAKNQRISMISKISLMQLVLLEKDYIA